MQTIRSDGTLDYKSFLDELYKFNEIANRNLEQNVTWKMERFHDDIGGLVLIRKSLIKVNTSTSNDEVSSDEELHEIDEKECEVETKNWISIEHQIVYNISYSVPLLYFKCCFLNGKPLTISEVWKLIPRFCNQCDETTSEEQLITMITQFEHPIIQKPYFAVHPCKTGELMSGLMKSFEKSKINYILSWLSTIGPIAGLNLRFKHLS